MKFQQDYRKLLDPHFISKIDGLDLKARLVVEGFMIGLHRSPYHGFSVEFSQHRQYMPGDEISRIDWKVFAKTDKYFIKQYEEETNLKAYVILDSSRSMAFSSGTITKYQYGSILAAALAYLMINQSDSVGLVQYSTKLDNIIPPRASRNNLIDILKSLSALQPNNATYSAECLNQISEKIKNRGLVIIISDFFDDLQKVLSAIKRFKSKKNEIIVFQILDRQELDFNFGRDSIFKDLETEEELLTQPFHIQKSYKALFQTFIKEFSTECGNNQIEYNLITTDQPYDKALLAFLKKRQKLF
ncbi:MAG: DUF58 domain-containing protein [Ignavibacteria bacterium]|nr:DUF58 domain-containing protein [Ignavibacteria bacterium]